MTTLASRIIRSSPYRDTTSTWELIVELLTQGKQCAASAELMSVAGVASSIIAERAPKDAAIIATCDGPRTRIYCLYDDDAIEGSDAKEDSFGYEPLKGSWAISLPCPADDLPWVQRALRANSSRVTARNQSSTLGESEDGNAKSQGLTPNVEAFLKS
jgi:hypothetical protein